MLGFSTHGLQLLPAYLQALTDWTMASRGDPTVIADHGHAMTWDANWLPGAVVVNAALDAAYARMDRNATVTIAVRKSSHIGCLATHSQAAARRGYFLLLTCSDPAVASVAPH